jgi:hypothetical protein
MFHLSRLTTFVLTHNSNSSTSHHAEVSGGSTGDFIRARVMNDILTSYRQKFIIHVCWLCALSPSLARESIKSRARVLIKTIHNKSPDAERAARALSRLQFPASSSAAPHNVSLTSSPSGVQRLEISRETRSGAPLDAIPSISTDEHI